MVKGKELDEDDTSDEEKSDDEVGEEETSCVGISDVMSGNKDDNECECQIESTDAGLQQTTIEGPNNGEKKRKRKLVNNKVLL